MSEKPTYEELEQRIRELEQAASEHKQTEKRLRESEKKFRTFFETTNDAVFVHLIGPNDTPGHFIEANAIACKRLGYTREELLRLTPVEIGSSELKTDPRKKTAELKKHGTLLFETVHVSKEGRQIPVESHLRRFKFKGQQAVLSISRDITERKQTEKRLRESEARFKALHNASFGGIAIHGNGLIHECNKSLAEISGYSLDELIGMDVLSLISEETRDTASQNIAAGYEKPYEVTGIRKNGEMYPLRLEARSIPYKGKNVRVVEFRDITERKRAEEEKEILEEQLRQAQKMDSVGRLAGGVAHDFNNMLGVILGHVEMAMDDLPPTHPIHADLQEIRAAAERSAELTRQLLAFARKQVVDPKVLNLNRAVESMLSMLRRLIGENIDLDWRPGRDLWTIKVDPAQIDQILANLCINARDAIADVGKLTIETGTARFDDAYCAMHADFVPGEYVLLGVSDDGRGMAKDVAVNIFEPFFTTKAVGEGSGLGLAMVYGIVKQNNGFINVSSAPGKGTTIKIYLPRHLGPARLVQNARPAASDRLDNETILLVEDEPAILNMTRQMLRRLGYTVVAAATPDEAIRMARDSAGKISLLMTDVVMPEMNGRDLASTLLSRYPDLKRLFMSGHTANVIAHHGVLEKGVHFIQKPFSKKDLAAKLNEVLRG